MLIVIYLFGYHLFILGINFIAYRVGGMHAKLAEMAPWLLGDRHACAKPLGI